MEYITTMKVDFIQGLLQGEEFRAAEAIHKSSWNTIWDRLIAAIPHNNPTSTGRELFSGSQLQYHKYFEEFSDG